MPRPNQQPNSIGSLRIHAFLQSFLQNIFTSLSMSWLSVIYFNSRNNEIFILSSIWYLFNHFRLVSCCQFYHFSFIHLPFYVLNPLSFPSLFLLLFNLALIQPPSNLCYRIYCWFIYGFYVFHQRSRNDFTYLEYLLDAEFYFVFVAFSGLFPFQFQFPSSSSELVSSTDTRATHKFLFADFISTTLLFIA